MKSFCGILVISCLSLIGRQSIKNDFSINIWDFDYSMALTTHYKIDNDSLIITVIGGLQKEENNILVKRGMNDFDKKILFDFLTDFPLDSLSSEYKNHLIQDGDQKRIELLFKDKRKIISIRNYYQPDIACLFRFVNLVVGKDYKILYQK